MTSEWIGSSLASRGFAGGIVVVGLDHDFLGRRSFAAGRVRRPRFGRLRRVPQALSRPWAGDFPDVYPLDLFLLVTGFPASACSVGFDFGFEINFSLRLDFGGASISSARSFLPA